MTREFLKLSLVTTVFLLPNLMAQTTRGPETVSLTENTQIPGAMLKAGTYTFEVEDRMADRAVVRISDTHNRSDHHLLLSVPNPKLTPMGRLAFFKTTGEAGQALQSWKCATCKAPLEFVYPKLEAVKITDESTKPVLAVDPSYDKLPDHLSADDMKVVTLWLLSPERITSDNVGQGVKAVKYNKFAQAPSQVAANTRRHLPKTASSAYLFELMGIICLLGACVLGIARPARG